MKNIIEIGANNGSHTGRFFQKSNVWCFEPNPHYVSILSDIFKNNDNIKIIQKAVSDFNGEAHFYISEDGSSSSLNNLTDFATNNTQIKYVDKMLVSVIRMDTFLDDIDIDVIDYLHCDAQGEDLKILKSFGDKLHIIQKGKIEASLRNELYSNTSNNINDTIEFLTNNGFEIINLREIDNYKLNVNRYDCDIQFCKKNNNRLI